MTSSAAIRHISPLAGRGHDAHLPWNGTGGQRHAEKRGYVFPRGVELANAAAFTITQRVFHQLDLKSLLAPTADFP